jgi:O-antigen/teichoic acid export membrane protein
MSPTHESGTHTIPDDAALSARQTPPPIRALEARAIRAALWTVAEYGSGQVLRVVSSLVLTRLLLPAYFGEITLVTTLILGINLLSDIGLAPSVIQSPRGDDPVFLDTAFTLQALRGVALWIVSLLLAWPMAVFYHDAKLKALLPVLGLCTLLSGFNSTNLLTLSRHMGVRRLFAIDFSTAVCSLVVTIGWALIHPSVWAIIGGQIAGTVYRYALSWIPSVTPGPRNRFGWDKGCVRSIVHFGRWIMAATAFYFFASQADRLVLGHLITLSLLGVYGIAYQLSDIPRQIILALSQRVFYPFIAKIIDIPIAEFREKFLRYRFMVLTGSGLLLAIMVTWGPLLILKLYDPRYAYGAWIIPILSLGLWDTLLHQTTAPVLLSLGKPKYGAIGNALWCVGILATIPIAFHFYGMHGAVIAIAFGDLPIYIVTQYGATREGVKPLRQDFVVTCIFAVFIAACFSVRHLIHIAQFHMHHA